MAGYGEVVSPGWFQESDTVISLDDDDIWLSTHLQDEHLDGEKILKEHQEQTHQPPTRPFAKPMTDEEVHVEEEEEEEEGNTPKKLKKTLSIAFEFGNNGTDTDSPKHLKIFHRSKR